MTESNKLFVGNLDRSVTRQDLKEYFTFEKADGTTVVPDHTSVASDRETGRSRGFGFVTFPTTEDASEAREMFNEKEYKGRTMYIDVAKARDDAPRAEQQEESSEEFGEEM